MNKHKTHFFVYSMMMVDQIFTEMSKHHDQVFQAFRFF